MTHLASISSLLDFLSVELPVRAEAEALLADFTALPEDSKTLAQASLIAAIFPLVFKDKTLIEGSSTYEESRTQPW